MKKLLYALLFFPFILFAQTSSETDSRTSKIDSLIAVDNLALADELLTEALEENDENSLKSRQKYVQGLLNSAGDCEVNIPYLEAAKELLGGYQKAHHFYWTHLQKDYMNCLVQVRDMGKLTHEKDRVLQLFKNLPNTLAEAGIMYNVGLGYRMEDNYAMAVKYYLQAINFYEHHDPIPLNSLAEAYNNAGYAYSQMGIFSKQVEYLTKAYEIDAENENAVHQHLIQSLAQLIMNFSFYGDEKKAHYYLDELDKKIAEWTAPNQAGQLQMPPLAYQFYSYWMHSFSASALMNKEKATTALADFDKFMEQLPPQMQMPFKLYYLSAVMQYAGQEAFFVAKSDREIRLEAINKGLSISREVGDVFYEAGGLYYLAGYYRQEEDFQNALQTLNQAIAIGQQSRTAMSVGDNRAVGEQHLLNYQAEKALVFSKLGQWEKVPGQLEEAFSPLLREEQKNSDKGVLLSLDEKSFEERVHATYISPLVTAAELYEGLYERSQKKQDAQLSLHLYELAAKVFNQYYLKGEYNSRLSELNRKINEGIFGNILELGISLENDIINQLENNASQHLRKEFEQKHRQDLIIPDSLFARQKLLQAEREFYRAALANDNKEAKDKIASITAELKKIDAKINTIDPSYFPFFRDAFDISEVQNNLLDNELMLDFVVGEQSIYVLAISNKSISPVYLGKKDVIFEEVSAFYNASQSISPEYQGPAGTLYKLLIAPLDNYLSGMENLVIIPDHQLNYLPFEALQNPDTERLLVQDFAITYSQSIRLWSLQSNELPASANRDFLAVFVPEYPSDYFSAIDTTAIVFRDGNRLLDLKGAASEAHNIARMLKGKVFEKQDATKQNFINNIDDYQVYHLAMHALMNEEDYQKSHLVFQGEQPLYYSDLYGLNFPADLVVLSACNTGMGELKDGEGLLGLSRALTYSGVKSSVYSLWQVPDEETSEIMVSFYSYLENGTSKHEALAMAKRDFISKNPMKAHPFFWAGFVLNGNNSAISTESSYNKYLLYGGLIVLLLIVVVSVKRFV